MYGTYTTHCIAAKNAKMNKVLDFAHIFSRFFEIGVFKV